MAFNSCSWRSAGIVLNRDISVVCMCVVRRIPIIRIILGVFIREGNEISRSAAAIDHHYGDLTRKDREERKWVTLTGGSSVTYSRTVRMVFVPPSTTTQTTGIFCFPTWPGEGDTHKTRGSPLETKKNSITVKGDLLLGKIFFEAFAKNHFPSVFAHCSIIHE